MLEEENTRMHTPPKRVHNQSRQSEKVHIAAGSLRNTFKSKEIANKIPSVEHFMYLYSTEGQYYLPPKQMLTWSYIKQILIGEKLLIKFDSIQGQMILPKARGVRVADLFEKLENDLELMKYFPDMSPDRVIPREYFFTVMSKGIEGGSATKISLSLGIPEQREEKN